MKHHSIIALFVLVLSGWNTSAQATNFFDESTLTLTIECILLDDNLKYSGTLELVDEENLDFQVTSVWENFGCEDTAGFSVDGTKVAILRTTSSWEVDYWLFADYDSATATATIEHIFTSEEMLIDFINTMYGVETPTPCMWSYNPPTWTPGQWEQQGEEWVYDVGVVGGEYVEVTCNGITTEYDPNE